MTRDHHRDQATQRIRASDYQWQEAGDMQAALGSVREAVVALTEAVLALSAPDELRPAPDDKRWLETTR